MIETSLADALNDCIDRLNAGQRLADCVAIYPQYAAELESLLALGGLVSQSQASESEAAEARAQNEFRFEQALARPRSQPHSFEPLRLARLAASIVLVFAFLAAGTGLLAERSLPGDALYDVKLLTETLRLTLANHDPAMQAMFDAQRLDEARALVQLRREAELTLRGRVDAGTADSMEIDGLRVQTTDNRDLVGSLVEVDVISTGQGELIARDIRVVEPPPDMPPYGATVQPTLSDTPVPARTPTRQATQTPFPTVRPTRTPSLMVTLTLDRPEATPTTLPQDSAGTCQESPSGWMTYTIQSGDTLSDLAARSGTSLDSIASANCIDDVRRIVAGETILLPRSLRPATTAGTEDATQQGTTSRDVTPTPDAQRERDQQQDRQRQSASDTSPTQVRSGGDRSR